MKKFKLIMKNFTKITCLLAALILSANISFAQIINEDFTGWTGTTPQNGWTQTMFTGESGCDDWHFDDPGNIMGLPSPPVLPISPPFAIFDGIWACSCGACLNTEVVYLISPAFDATSLGSPVNLIWDQFYHLSGFDEIRVEVFNGVDWNNIVYTNSSASGDVQDSQSFNIFSIVNGVSNAQVRFRYEGDDDWYWIVDNVKIEAIFQKDVALTQALISPDEYTITPLSQVQPFCFEIEVTNVGTDTAFNVSAYIDINTVNLDSFIIDTILPDSITGIIPFDSCYTPSDTGNYIADYSVAFTGDPILANNVASINFEINDSVYAREDGTYDGPFGLGPGQTGIFGQIYDVLYTDTLTSISFFLETPFVGDTVWAVVYGYSNGPTTEIVRTVPYIIPASDTKWYTLPIIGGSVQLTPGTYFIGVNETSSSLSLKLGYTILFYADSTCWVYDEFSTSWYTVEFWYGLDFSFLVRGNFGIPPPEFYCYISDTVNASCYDEYDGSATLSISGGVPPYSILWQPIAITDTTFADSLCDGTYTVYITDAVLAVDSVTFTITQPDTLTAILSSTPESMPTAFDGTVTAVPSGGSGVYTYEWNDGSTQTTATATGLGAGWYTVTVTDTICVEVYIDSVEVIIGPVITLDSSANMSCFGVCDGQIYISVTGGASPYTYQWSDGPTTTEDRDSLCADSYTVTVTDAGLNTNTLTVVITEPTALSGSIIAQTNVLCYGDSTGSVEVEGSEGTPGYTYDIGSGAQANGIFGSLIANNYTVTITDTNACTVDVPVTITEPGAPLSCVTDSTMDNGDNDGTATVTVSGGTPPYTYLWNDTAGTTDATATGLTGDLTYYVTVTDSNSCTLNTSVFVVLSGIEELSDADDIKLFPNPTDGKLYLILNDRNLQEISVKIYNVIGEMAMELTNKKGLTKGQYTIDLSALPNGIYFVKVKTGDSIITRKISLIK